MASILLDDLVTWCNQTLNTTQFTDYCPNGLQIQGSAKITRIVTGVTASRALIEHAISQQADAIITHHGYFWKGEVPELVGLKAERIRLLMQHNISLIAYHLPLDLHPTLGNNSMLAERLGFINGKPINDEPQQLVFSTSITAISASAFKQQLEQQLARPVIHIAGGDDTISRVAWCTGAAQNFITRAAAYGCQAYISGEISERTVHEARELGIHYFACGHHSTETGGIQALGNAIAKQFTGIEVKFIDLPHLI